jgi:hypothetical protein
MSLCGHAIEGGGGSGDGSMIISSMNLTRSTSFIKSAGCCGTTAPNLDRHPGKASKLDDRKIIAVSSNQDEPVTTGNDIIGSSRGNPVIAVLTGLNKVECGLAPIFLSAVGKEVTTRGSATDAAKPECM